MHKSYFETILNNSHLTKKYQLKMSGYFGDSGNKDVNFMQIEDMDIEIDPNDFVNVLS